jgi:uncharacterized protein YjcR
MRDHHQEIIRLLSTGMKAKVVASTLNCDVQTVRNIRRSRLGQALVSALHADRNVTIAKTAERIDALAPRAAEIYEEIAHDPDVDKSLQYRVAKDLLSGTGLLVNRSVSAIEHPYLTNDQIKELKGRFKKDFGSNIEEVKFEEVEDVSRTTETVES